MPIDRREFAKLVLAAAGGVLAGGAGSAVAGGTGRGTGPAPRRGGCGGGRPPKKGPPTAQEIRSVVSGRSAAIRGCFDRDPPAAKITLKVKCTVKPSGRVGEATVAGDLADSPAARCVLEIFRGLRFRSWKGDSFTFTYPVAWAPPAAE